MCNNYVRVVYVIMELNDDLFKSHSLHQSIKNVLCPRRGLNCQETAIYVGVSPKPRTVWDIHQLDECFDAVFAPDDAPTPISSSADFNPDEARDILTLEIAMPDQRHPDALRLMRLAEQEIARIATEVGPKKPPKPP